MTHMLCDSPEAGTKEQLLLFREGRGKNCKGLNDKRLSMGLAKKQKCRLSAKVGREIIKSM